MSLYFSIIQESASRPIIINYYAIEVVNIEVYDILNLSYIRLLKILWNMSITKLSMHDTKILNKCLQIPSKVLTVSALLIFVCMCS